jgi:death-on-curing protein
LALGERGGHSRLHEQQIAEHGGGSGLRDSGLLRSALARPQNKAAHAAPEAAALAAAYAFAIARNPPFVDGNKRMALLAAELFLTDNGYEFAAEDAAVYGVVMRLAEGTLGEAGLASWMRENIVKA